MKKCILPLLLCLFVLSSCQLSRKNESNLGAADLAYIQQLIPLQAGEEIELFETNGGWKGLKTAGNFITNKGLASYWIEDGDEEVHYVNYNQIDSLKTMDKVQALTYASYLIVYPKNKNKFKVYVDADSARTWEFFGLALENWEKKKD